MFTDGEIVDALGRFGVLVFTGGEIVIVAGAFGSRSFTWSDTARAGERARVRATRVGLGGDG